MKLDELGTAWKPVAQAWSQDGARVEKWHATFGKGRGKIDRWKFFRDGEQCGYAATKRDAEENWERVLDGGVLNVHTGRWEPAS